jgi:hypothetical protein
LYAVVRNARQLLKDGLKSRPVKRPWTLSDLLHSGILPTREDAGERGCGVNGARVIRLLYVAVVTGVSGIVVVDGSVGGVTGSYGAAVPSAPDDGCGGACPPPWPEGVAVALCAGCETAGGWFW